MTHDPKKRHRRSIRLRGYDYTSPGFYFVTICVRGGECVLGEVVDGEMQLNDGGQVVHDFWSQVPVHFPSVSIVRSQSCRIICMR
jgi:putative transposase